MQFSAPSLAVSNEASLTGKKRRCRSPGSARALLSSGFLSQHPVKLQPGSSLLTGGRGRLCSCWCQGQSICSGADQRRASKGLLQKHRALYFPTRQGRWPRPLPWSTVQTPREVARTSAGLQTKNKLTFIVSCNPPPQHLLAPRHWVGP